MGDRDVAIYVCCVPGSHIDSLLTTEQTGDRRGTVITVDASPLATTHTPRLSNTAHDARVRVKDRINSSREQALGGGAELEAVLVHERQGAAHRRALLVPTTL